jgi:hypothetical protein
MLWDLAHQREGVTVLAVQKARFGSGLEAPRYRQVAQGVDGSADWARDPGED